MLREHLTSGKYNAERIVPDIYETFFLDLSSYQSEFCILG